MGNKVAANEADIENVAIRNRPTKVAEDYEKVVSDLWLGAKETLDNELTNSNEHDKLHLLNHVFKVL